MMNLSFLLQFLTSISGFSAATEAIQTDQFDQSRLRCYSFNIADTPEARMESMNLEPEIWCYFKAETSDQYLFVFKVGHTDIRPELSFIVDSDGYIIHGSLHVGAVSYHKVKASEYNPFSVPAYEPQNRKQVAPPHFSVDRAKQVLNTLVQYRENGIVSVESLFAIKEGRFSASAEAVVTPWRGFWWPYKNRTLYGGKTSPLAKYDQYVRSHTSRVSSAQAWESSHHFYRRVWWEGHCNGWAASSVLRAEPRFSRLDPISGLVFSVADQKGILAEVDYCSVNAFFGNRYRGRATDNKRDIAPALFHKTLTYYIGKLRKPVIIDYRADSPVDNHPVSAYKMNIKQITPSTFEVVATLKFHKYDTRRSYPPGEAPSYNRVYKYTLIQNDDGLPTGGSWRSSNPDFVWVPLGIGDCNRNNPFINHDLVAEITSLPIAPE